MYSRKPYIQDFFLDLIFVMVNWFEGLDSAANYTRGSQ